jgi:hypothetical protein
MKQKLLLFSVLIISVSLGFSQEMGKFGFFFKAGSSSNVGLAINLSDQLTLRPSIGFYTIKEKWETGDSDENDGYSLDLGLFYHYFKRNHFTAYSGLEIGYIYQTQDMVGSNPSNSETFQKSHGYRGNLILGFQYNFNKHVAVFGEIGFGFQRENTDIERENIIVNSCKYTSWRLDRSGFGIVLYL